MKKKILALFKQPLFWTQLLSIVVIMFLLKGSLSVSSENLKLQETIDKNRELNQKAFTYVRQLNADTNFYDMLIDFTTASDKASANLKEYINYSSDDASLDIAPLYVKKDDSNLLATGIDTSKDDVFLVGVDMVNKSTTPVTVNPKEFFLKSKDDYLKYDSIFFDGEQYNDGRVLIPAGETKTVVIFYGGDKNKDYKNLEVQYGTQFWK
ncbi:DUF4352 domain-containing protein [Streptococcus gallolyticus subsp. gallolyticus]|uniref:DUF4352 domain-containing protein n=3 Tax=Streptococcus TaxID=1301 RepID=UPI0020977476|nr:DUF4352 domain-containing protein [Streptococcus gallolyticus]MCO7178292.1 DUF4352 domain-containing protein [Streptococcus gallolyticus]